MSIIETDQNLDLLELDASLGVPEWAVPDATLSASKPLEHITMLLENMPYPQDVRVRSEAESLARAGHRVTTFAPNDGTQPRRERINGVNVVRYRLRDGSSAGQVGFLREYLVAAAALHVAAITMLFRGSTVLHIHNPPDILFPAGGLYRLAGRRVIFDHHDLFPQTIDVKFGRGWASRVAAVCQRLTTAVAHHVIATNPSYAEVAKRSGKAAEEITVVRNGPPAAWTELPTVTREGVLRRVRIAYLGAMSSQDGVDRLAPILEALCQGTEPLDPHLLVIGDGDARSALAEDFARRGLADRVTFIGRVPPGRVPELLAGVDICVDPAPATDVNQRSTMTKIAEYLALGKPVVAFDLLETRSTAGDAAVLVADEDLVAFADAIRTLAVAPAMRIRLAHDARRRARSLTWEHSEQALFQAYATVGSRR